MILMLLSGVSTQAQILDNHGLVYYKMEVKYREPGLLSGSTTFAPGFMLNRDQLNFNLHGFAEYHMRRASVRGESYLFLNSPNSQLEGLKMFRTYFGMFYHLNSSYSGNWDVKLGFSPGLTYAENVQYLGGQEIRTTSLAPSFSAAIGFDYYVWKYFHFFSQVSFVQSTMRGFPNGSERMDELLISTGLGFQIPTRKPRKINH